VGYDRLLGHIFEDINKRLKAASFIVRARSEHERTQVVAANGRVAARAMLDLLSDLPAKVDAPNEQAFVLGFTPIEATLLAPVAREAAERWQGWKWFLYESALDFRLDDGPADVQLAFAARFTEIVGSELEPFLMPRLVFWRPDLEEQRWR
jgi:hypothetical protein